jgi:hypothetical protein
MTVEERDAEREAGVPRVAVGILQGWFRVVLVLYFVDYT